MQDFAMLSTPDVDENGERVDEIESLVKDVEEIELLENKVVGEEATKIELRKGQANHARRCLIIKLLFPSYQELF